MTRKKEVEGYRRCTRCKQLKTLDNFCKNKSSHDGLHYYCRDCAVLFHAETYWKDPEKSRLKYRQWNREHPKVYTPESHARKLEAQRRYREKNREALKKKGVEYYAKNKEHYHKYQREVRKTGEYRITHAIREIKRRAHKKNNGGVDFTREEWDALCNKYGNKCLACGNAGKLTIDHVVPLSRGGSNSIDNIQPLCLGCNLSKHDKIIDYR